jgi:hypothetical protein
VHGLPRIECVDVGDEIAEHPFRSSGATLSCTTPCASRAARRSFSRVAHQLAADDDHLELAEARRRRE